MRCAENVFVMDDIGKVGTVGSNSVGKTDKFDSRLKIDFLIQGLFQCLRVFRHRILRLRLGSILAAGKVIALRNPIILIKALYEVFGAVLDAVSVFAYETEQ